MTTRAFAVWIAAAQRPASGSSLSTAMIAAAHEAMPDARVLDAVWLSGYDSYYYDRHGMKPLPVLRVRYDDPRKTWLYLDPQHGAAVLKQERLTRLNRWLYHGLHSLDVPFLYYRRPAWDLVVVGLSLVASLFVAFTFIPGVGSRILGSVRPDASGKSLPAFARAYSEQVVERWDTLARLWAQGVDVPWALMYPISSGVRPASSTAFTMARAAPLPPGRGRVM